MLRTVEAILSHLDFDTINKWIVPVAGTNTGYPYGELRMSNETASVPYVSWATVLGKCGRYARAHNGHAKPYSTEGARRLKFPL
jgi:hypothetical protein